MPPQWIFGLVGLAAGLGFGVLFHKADPTVGAGVTSLAQSIVTGAFGIAVGHAYGKNQIDPTKLPAGSLVQSTDTVQTPPIIPSPTDTTQGATQ